MQVTTTAPDSSVATALSEWRLRQGERQRTPRPSVRSVFASFRVFRGQNAVRRHSRPFALFAV